MIRKTVLGVLICIYGWFLVMMDLPSLNMKYKDEFIFTVICALTLLGLIACCLAMLLGKEWARRPLLILNGIYLLFGIYMLHFAWTFYIFKKPTLLERIGSLKMPLLLGIIVPLAVFRYFQSKKNK